jgi:DNA topoisomerase-1
VATQVETLQRTGIRRLGTARSGFRWVRADGSRPSAGELDRLDALKLPPAWTDVVASPSPGAALQAVGRDAAERWQYRYHPAAVKRRDERKYRRLVHFAEALPTLRRTVARHLAQPGLGREKVLAAIVRILSTCFLRPGSQAYAAENGSYGIATLRNDHVHVVGDRVRFDFPGKAGKRQVRELRDRRLARIVRELKAAGRPRDEVFKFRNGAGELVDVRRRHVNDYIKEVMGERFSAKDFRTWAGTLVAASALARGGADTAGGKAARKRSITAAVREAADLLGNTPAICRASYVAPQILERFERGDVVERHVETAAEIVGHRGSGLHPAERALLDMLRRCHRNDAAAAGGWRAAAPARGAVRRSAPTRKPGAPPRRRAARRASTPARISRRGAKPRRGHPARAAAASGDAARGRNRRRAGASPASVFSPRVRATA